MVKLHKQVNGNSGSQREEQKNELRQNRIFETHFDSQQPSFGKADPAYQSSLKDLPKKE